MPLQWAQPPPAGLSLLNHPVCVHEECWQSPDGSFEMLRDGPSGLSSYELQSILLLSQDGMDPIQGL